MEHRPPNNPNRRNSAHQNENPNNTQNQNQNVNRPVNRSENQQPTINNSPFSPMFVFNPNNQPQTPNNRNIPNTPNLTSENTRTNLFNPEGYISNFPPN